MSEHTAPSETIVDTRPTIRLRVPPGWARGFVAGVYTALLGWAISVIAVVGTFAMVASNPWLGHISWSQVLDAGGDLWGLILGGTLTVETMTIRIVPLLAPLGLLVILRVLLRSGKEYPSNAIWFAIPGFGLTACVTAWALQGHLVWWSILPGAFLLPFIGSAWAWAGRNDNGVSRLPSTVRRALKVCRQWLIATSGLSMIVLIVAVFTSWERIVGIHDLFLIEALAQHIVAIVAQLFLVPHALIWSLAWIAGPGFFLGTDALHSPTTAPVAPIPVVPLLGATPSGVVGWAVVLIPIAVGIGMGLWQGYAAKDQSLRDLCMVMLAATPAYFLVILGVGFLSTASLGAARMSVLGPVPWQFAAALSAEVAVVAFVVAACIHRDTVTWVTGHVAHYRAGTGVAQPKGKTEPATGDTSVPAEAASVIATNGAAAGGLALGDEAEEAPTVGLTVRAEDTGADTPVLDADNPNDQVHEPAAGYTASALSGAAGYTASHPHTPTAIVEVPTAAHADEETNRR
ncbi:DUF6350 family protein [Schaalia suimastitidis]|uniref:cell division protein PerM n=1 Tax=Schaalia suimastitidis TaxID=121163 RepID=UPI00042107B9|nr:DUF6350 family protein [Schaalia suimastitidis]